MELGLSLGPSKQTWLGFNTSPFIPKPRDQYQEHEQITEKQEHRYNYNSDSTTEEATNESLNSLKANNNPVLLLDLLSHTPPHLSFPWQPPLEIAGSTSRGLEANMPLAPANVEDEADEEEMVPSSSPNSIASTFLMDLCMVSRRCTDEGYDLKGCSSRARDEDENSGRSGRRRKKLRLSKEQSGYLEESYKEHNTINPKQKIVLAKQLHLRPRQVEVWFQNRRARTKLKKIEMECENLKRCCDTLKEKNTRLHKEFQELKALKTSNPYYMHLPATTLSMCPSCERVASSSISCTTTAKTIDLQLSEALT